MVEESLAGGEQHIVHARLYLLGEGAVASDAEFLVGAIVSHDIYLCGRQFIAVLLVHPALHRLYDVGVEEAVDVVEASAVASVAAEVSLVLHSLEGHAEVVALRVEREAWVL